MPTLVEPGSEVPHFIPEPGSFSEFTRLPADVKKAWLKAIFKEIRHLIKNHNFLIDDSEKGEPVTPCIDI